MTATTGGKDTRIVHVADADAAIEAIRSAGRRIVTFVGFSGAGYEDAAAMERLVDGFLAQFDPASVIVASGATAQGIGAVYRLAAARGFATIGIVSAVAEAEHAQFSDAVDTIYVVEDKDWGGRRPDGTLSPTSATMVGSADEMIAIGGGSIAREEIEAARALGKTVRYAAADMDHASAIEKAGGKGEPAPDEFKGAVHRLFEDR